MATGYPIKLRLTQNTVCKPPLICFKQVLTATHKQQLVSYLESGYLGKVQGALLGVHQVQAVVHLDLGDRVPEDHHGDQVVVPGEAQTVLLV